MTAASSHVNYRRKEAIERNRMRRPAAFVALAGTLAFVAQIALAQAPPRLTKIELQPQAGEQLEVRARARRAGPAASRVHDRQPRALVGRSTGNYARARIAPHRRQGGRCRHDRRSRSLRAHAGRVQPQPAAALFDANRRQRRFRDARRACRGCLGRRRHRECGRGGQLDDREGRLPARRGRRRPHPAAHQ